MQQVRSIGISDIAFNLFQCRTKRDRKELWKITDSIKSIGVKVPIVVYRNKSKKYSKKKYVLESGERRITMSLDAGRETILAIICDREPTDDDLRINSLVENCLREDLCP